MKTRSTILILTCLLFAACNSVLDLDPITEQTEEKFYRTESDAFQALVAVYDVLQWSAPQNENCPFEVVSEQIADCCYGGGGNSNDVPAIVRMSRWEMDPNDRIYDALWYKYYAGIFRANLFLQKIEGIAFQNQDDKNRMIAEAHFLRAYFYFDLVRLFENIPLILHPLERSEYYTQAQAAPSLTYAQLKKDLVVAIEHGLPNLRNILASETGRVSKHAAEALLARVWLYYTGAYGQTELDGLSKTGMITYIEDVVHNSGASLLQDYSDIFKVSNKNNRESIFEIQYTSGSGWSDWGNREGTEGNQAIILWGIRSPEEKSPYSSGWSFAPVRASLWRDFDPVDSRRHITLVNMAYERYTYLPGFQNTGIFNKKYTALKENEPTAGGSRALNFPNNYISIRYADVLLMAAELQLEENNTRAQEYYDMVVKRAFGHLVHPPNVTKELIMEQRLFELALEGHRYWDLRRQGLDVTKATIERDNSKVREVFRKTFDLRFKGLFPLPQSQLLLCKQFKQNEGY